MSAEGAARAWETGMQVVVKGKEADVMMMHEHIQHLPPHHHYHD